jgi:hypothetical protein
MRGTTIARGTRPSSSGIDLRRAARLFSDPIRGVALESSGPRYHHRQPITRPKRIQRLDVERMAGEETQPEALGGHREHDLHLGRRELTADARARARAEGNVSKARPRACSTRQEPVGPKRVRIALEGGVTLQDIGAEDGRSTRRDHVLAHPVRSSVNASAREPAAHICCHRWRPAQGRRSSIKFYPLLSG